ncbi:Histone acetyltransferase complex subunit [Blyttiomyces sp. JEL0837]|nr:Histone acetyltransferase complex subunit [Blyttiomyces sp. JEL0837]
MIMQTNEPRSGKRHAEDDYNNHSQRSSRKKINAPEIIKATMESQLTSRQTTQMTSTNIVDLTKSHGESTVSLKRSATSSTESEKQDGVISKKSRGAAVTKKEKEDTYHAVAIGSTGTSSVASAPPTLLAVGGDGSGSLSSSLDLKTRLNTRGYLKLVKHSLGIKSEGCKIEWFHLDCVNMTEPPSGVWFCPDCTLLLQPTKRRRLLSERSQTPPMVKAAQTPVSLLTETEATRSSSESITTSSSGRVQQLEQRDKVSQQQATKLGSDKKTVSFGQPVNQVQTKSDLQKQSRHHAVLLASSTKQSSQESIVTRKSMTANKSKSTLPSITLTTKSPVKQASTSVVQTSSTSISPKQDKPESSLVTNVSEGNVLKSLFNLKDESANISTIK